MAINSRLKSLAEKEGQSSRAYVDRTNAEYNPRFEPQIENLTRYQEPSALLMHFLIVDRVTTPIQIPRLHDVTPDAFKTRAESIKVKIKESELRMIDYLERYQSMRHNFRFITGRAEMLTDDQAASPRQTLKASFITYLTFKHVMDTRIYLLWHRRLLALCDSSAPDDQN